MFELLKPSHPKERVLPKKEAHFTIDDVEEIMTPDEKYEFGHELRKIYMTSTNGWDEQSDLDQAAEWAQAEHAYDYSILEPEKSNTRQFVVRDENEGIIAGAQMKIFERNGVKTVYLGSKFVRPEYRNQNIAHLLVQKRLDVAREEGCEDATAIVAWANGPALRTIMKDSFIMEEVPASVLADKRRIPTSYSMRRNLQIPIPGPITKEQLLNATIIGNGEQIDGKSLLIPHENSSLILEALTKGYIGRWVVLPKELDVITKPMVYLEKKEEYLKGLD